MDKTKTKYKKQKCEYAVTFEFNVKLPITIRGEIEASALGTLASRAVKQAKIKARQPESIEKYGTIASWSSISILLDRFKFMGNKDANTEIT